MNVLLYHGLGCTSSLQNALFLFLKHSLRANYDVILVNETMLRNEPWQETTALLVIPGGRDLKYLEGLQV